MVISVIALFAALGGGYALAFSGSGSLQKGSATNLTTSFTSFRTLTGIGNLQARCATGPDRTELRFHNSTSETLVVQGVREGDSAFLPGAGVDPGGDSTAFSTAAPQETFRFHILPEDGSKAPQADIVVYAEEPGGGDCLPPDFSGATALVLNTQQ
jgi:hypothetical protein